MKVFDDQANVSVVGQRTVDFPLDTDLSLSDLAGFPILFVFWKTL